jgi:NAD(P)-dependent dehydrogenase (short-subunit alcohol dehydrogenase family)
LGGSIVEPGPARAGRLASLRNLLLLSANGALPMTARGVTAHAAAPSLSDKVVVVTGANAGLGFELSRRLARMGAHVVMACRSLPRAQRARERLRGEVPTARTTVLPLDVAELESIRKFCTLFADQVGHLDILINNAGIVGTPLARNSAGHELHLATNYLGPFSLTGTLLPRFRDRSGARIVSVGSLAHLFGRLCPTELNPTDSDYDAWRAYARSKVALVMYTIELNRRLRWQSSNIIAVAAHPGMALTSIMDKSPVANSKGAFRKWLGKPIRRLIPTVAEAVEPLLHAACAEGVRGGDYYGPGGWLEIAGTPAKARLNRRASNEDLARQLWSTSETLTGVRYLNEDAASRQCRAPASSSRGSS